MDQLTGETGSMETVDGWIKGRIVIQANGYIALLADDGRVWIGGEIYLN